MTFFELTTSFFNRNFKSNLIEYQDFYKINSVCLEMTLLINDIIKHEDNDVECFFQKKSGKSKNFTKFGQLILFKILDHSVLNIFICMYNNYSNSKNDYVRSVLEMLRVRYLSIKYCHKLIVNVTRMISLILYNLKFSVGNQIF